MCLQLDFAASKQFVHDYFETVLKNTHLGDACMPSTMFESLRSQMGPIASILVLNSIQYANFLDFNVPFKACMTIENSMISKNKSRKQRSICYFECYGPIQLLKLSNIVEGMHALLKCVFFEYSLEIIKHTLL